MVKFSDAPEVTYRWPCREAHVIIIVYEVSEVWTLLKNTKLFDGSMLFPFPTHKFSSTLTSLIETSATTGQHQVASQRQRAQLWTDLGKRGWGARGLWAHRSTYTQTSSSQWLTADNATAETPRPSTYSLLYLHYHTTCVDSKTGGHK